VNGSRYVRSGGVRIHVVERGPADGQPVLLLHGFPEFWWSWRYQLDALAEAGYRAVAMDLRGFGESDRPAHVADYALPHALGDVEAVVETLGDRVSVVCHDWGAAVGWLYATLFPHRVERLTALSTPHPSAFAARVRTPRQLQASWYMFMFLTPGVAEEAMARNGYELLKLWWYGTAKVPLGEDVVDRYVEMFSRPGALEAGLNWYRANLTVSDLVSDHEVELPPVACPVLVLWGMDDAYLVPEVGRLSQRYCEGPYRFIELPDTGHWVQQERPDIVNRELLAFLR